MRYNRRNGHPENEKFQPSKKEERGPDISNHKTVEVSQRKRSLNYAMEVQHNKRVN